MSSVREKTTVVLAVVGAVCLAQMAVSSLTPTAHATVVLPPYQPVYSLGTYALIDANAQMHQQMNVEWTGDVDTDFMRSMVPHHQGAVDLAEIVLEHGNDPEVRALAKNVIATQKQEIAQMNRWLDQHAPKSSVEPQSQPQKHEH